MKIHNILHYKTIFKIIRCQCKTDCSSRRSGCRPKICPIFMLLVLVKKQTVETLKILVIFHMLKKTSVIMNQNTNATNHWTESTLTMLHAQNTYVIYRLSNWPAFEIYKIYKCSTIKLKITSMDLEFCNI